MAGDQHPAAPPVHQCRHRRAARGIEIVGRLVEQQQIGRVEAQPRDPHPRSLAARKRRHAPVERHRVQPGLGKRGGHALLQGPVGFGKVLRASLAGQHPGQLRQPFAHAEHFVDVPPARPFLAQHADAAGARDVPRHRRHFARDDAQQGRFARAVAPRQPGAFPPERQRQIIEERPALRRGGGKRIQGYEARHGTPAGRTRRSGERRSVPGAWRLTPWEFGKALSGGPAHG